MNFAFFSTIFLLRDKYDNTLIFYFGWCNLKMLIISKGLRFLARVEILHMIGSLFYLINLFYKEEEMILMIEI